MTVTQEAGPAFTCLAVTLTQAAGPPFTCLAVTVTQEAGPPFTCLAVTVTQEAGPIQLGRVSYESEANTVWKMPLVRN